MNVLIASDFISTSFLSELSSSDCQWVHFGATQFAVASTTNQTRRRDLHRTVWSQSRGELGRFTVHSLRMKMRPVKMSNTGLLTCFLRTNGVNASVTLGKGRSAMASCREWERVSVGPFKERRESTPSGVWAELVELLWVFRSSQRWPNKPGKNVRPSTIKLNAATNQIVVIVRVDETFTTMTFKVIRGQGQGEMTSVPFRDYFLARDGKNLTSLILALTPMNSLVGQRLKAAESMRSRRQSDTPSTRPVFVHNIALLHSNYQPHDTPPAL